MPANLPNPNPNFDLSPRALDFIKEHGGVLTMDEAPAAGCCNVVLVGARLGRPDDESYYRRITQDGIEIFYDPYLIKEEKKYEIGLEGFLRWKTLVVY